MPTYVQHEVLDRIPDVFNAEAIWQAPGFALFSRRPLLRDLLERSPRELRGRSAIRCFSHIQVRLPQDDVDDDYHLTRGNRARELAETLAVLHQKDFGDLLGSEEVRYHVAGDEHLAPGEIAVRFGHAVYLPASGEKALFNIATSRDGAVWKPACAVYAGQRLALLGGAGGIAAPGWPFGEQGGVLLVNDGPESELIVQVRPKDVLQCVFDASLGAYALCAKSGHGPRLLLKVTRATGAQPYATQAYPPAVWQARGIAGAAAGNIRSAGVTGDTVDAATTAAAAVGAAGAAGASGAAGAAGAVGVAGASGAAGAVRTAGSAGSAAAAGTGVAAGAVGTAGTGGAVGAAGAAVADDATAAPQRPQMAARIAAGAGWRAGEGDATFAPGALQRLSLVALAIPRLSLYRTTGATALHIPFAPDLAIGSNADAERALTIVAAADDTLHALSADGRRPITVPATLATTHRHAIRLVPAPACLAERYLALLVLPQPIAMPLLPGGALEFGRHMPALSALRVLDQPWMLQAATPSSPDRLGLSRKAFSCEASPQGLAIQRLSASQTLYRLDAALQSVSEVGDAGIVLEPGQHLVAGSYVLRYEG